MAEYKTIGDMPQAMQDELWDNDPNSITMTPELAAQREQDQFITFMDRGHTPEFIYSDEPEKRARYRAFLKSYKGPRIN